MEWNANLVVAWRYFIVFLQTCSCQCSEYFLAVPCVGLWFVFVAFPGHDKFAVVPNYTRICLNQTSEEANFEYLFMFQFCHSSRVRWFVFMLYVPVKKFKFSVFLGCMRGSKNFCRGGGSRPDCKKTALTLFFLSLQLILQFYSGLSMVYFKENYNFPRYRRGSNIFQWVEVQLLPGGGGLNANLYWNL